MLLDLFCGDTNVSENREKLWRPIFFTGLIASIKNNKKQNNFT